MVVGNTKMWFGGIGILLLLVCQACQAFLSSSKLQVGVRCEQSKIITITTLHGGLFGGKEKNSDGPSSSGAQPDLSAPTNVLEIPVMSIKKGGLRFLLGVYLAGLQDNGVWKPNQKDDNVLDVYFKDNSAMFSLVLDDDSIKINRYGQPSLAYVLQESLLLHKILDELNNLAFEVDENIEVENRLLQLEEPGDGIEKARASLPARKA